MRALLVCALLFVSVRVRDLSLPTYRSLVTMVMSLPLADDDDDGGDDVIRAASQGPTDPLSELLTHSDLVSLN